MVKKLEKAYFRENTDNLPKELKNFENNTDGEIFNLKKLTTGSKIWKIVSAFFALVFTFVTTFLLILQLNSYPNYLFSLWLFIIIEILLIFFIIGFLYLFFDTLFAHFNNDRYYVSLTEELITLRMNKKITVLPWNTISEYKIKRREHDNIVKSIELYVPFDESTEVIKISNLFKHNFNKISELISHHYQTNKPEEIVEEKKKKSWPIVIGLSVKNENLPEHITEIVTSNNKADNVLYFESKQNHFWKFFISLMGFILTFGFVMTILDFLGTTAFWGLELFNYNSNIKFFVISLLGLLSIGALALIVLNLVKIIKSTKQTLMVTKEGVIEKVFDIVYVIPWKSVKEITTKWFNYGAMHDNGELKIQLAYSEKPKGKANRIYNIQGEYHIEANQLLDVLKEHWEKK